MIKKGNWLKFRSEFVTSGLMSQIECLFYCDLENRSQMKSIKKDKDGFFLCTVRFLEKCLDWSLDFQKKTLKKFSQMGFVTIIRKGIPSYRWLKVNKDAVEQALQKKLQDNIPHHILELRSLPYQEYLKTDHWQNVRRQSLIEANYKCRVCNRNDILHVHHTTYERLGCELPEDVLSLCKTCHSKFHDKLPQEGVVK